MSSNLGGEDAPDVRREDQDRINEFGRLSMKKTELKEDITSVKKKIEDLSDAEEGVMMVDDSQPGATKLMVGESFVDVDIDTATNYITTETTKLKTLLTQYETELKRVETRQSELKKSLYGRFGKSINLEE